MAKMFLSVVQAYPIIVARDLVGIADYTHHQDINGYQAGQ